MTPSSSSSSSTGPRSKGFAFDQRESHHQPFPRLWRCWDVCVYWEGVVTTKSTTPWHNPVWYQFPPKHIRFLEKTTKEAKTLTKCDVAFLFDLTAGSRRRFSPHLSLPLITIPDERIVLYIFKFLFFFLQFYNPFFYRHTKPIIPNFSNVCVPLETPRRPQILSEIFKFHEKRQTPSPNRPRTQRVKRNNADAWAWFIAIGDDWWCSGLCLTIGAISQPGESSIIFESPTNLEWEAQKLTVH